MLVKKLFITLVAFIYLGVSSGVAYTIHYCMGKVSSVDVMTKKEKCNKCGMKTGGGCCKDEFKVIKLKDDHKLINNEIKLVAPLAIFVNPTDISKLNLFSTNVPSGFNNHSPPKSQGISLQILYSVFRI